MPYLNDPGVLRRFWWRSTPRRRLSVVCLSALLSVTATGFALSNAASPPLQKADRPTPGATPRSGDPMVTVQSVSEVNLFDGLDPTTGELVRVRVTAIRSTAPCWTDDAFAFARKTLDGKQVRLVKDDSGTAEPDGRLRAKVLLPTEQDYAQTVVAAGAALADTGSDEQLMSAEADAQQNGRGVWASACTPSGHHASDSSQLPPPTTTGTPGETTNPATSTVRPTTPVVVPPGPTTTTTAPQPPDDTQRGVKMGAPCSPEGARGVTSEGQDVRCKRTGEDGGGGLRWMKN